MMGRQQAAQAPLFYAFNLDDHVPANHLLRGIDQFLDLSDLHAHLSGHYSHTGRPSIDPALLIRMLIVGYCFGIRSERRLCEEVHLNLAYRWFCRLGLEDPIPDHSTFSKNRHGRFRDNVTLRFVFEQVLARCLSEGLVGGEGFATDASVIKADARRCCSSTRSSKLSSLYVLIATAYVMFGMVLHVEFETTRQFLLRPAQMELATKNDDCGKGQPEVSEIAHEPQTPQRSAQTDQPCRKPAQAATPPLIAASYEVM